MSEWFIYFLFYSFAGYCLEKLHARLSHSPHQVRKCFLLLPLCPVYGLAMIAVLALAPEGAGFFPLMVLGGIICTGAEFAVHLFYDKLFAVHFWDYTAMKGHVQGRICPHFSLIWGFLSAFSIRLIHPFVKTLAETVPPWFSFLMWVILAADCVLSAALLLRFQDIELLSLRALLSQTRAVSQSSTSL